MKFAIFVVFAAYSIVIAGCASEQAAGQNAANKVPQVVPTAAKQPVLVELYTSEGCSSCPPADRALALLEKEQPVNSADTVTLEFHVDYWDGPSWKDPFSSVLYSQRQEEYSSALKVGNNYTPQMVVDGRNEFVGSDLGKATQTIQTSVSDAKAKIDTTVNSGSIKVSLTDLPLHEASTVFVVAAEDNLTSNVTGGENGGAKLAHTSVVRELQAIGTIAKDARQFDIETALPSQPAWKKENLRYIVFAQENASRKVIAVSRVGK